jgi:hypothetical protein
MLVAEERGRRKRRRREEEQAAEVEEWEVKERERREETRVCEVGFWRRRERVKSEVAIFWIGETLTERGLGVVLWREIEKSPSSLSKWHFGHVKIKTSSSLSLFCLILILSTSV